MSLAERKTFRACTELMVHPDQTSHPARETHTRKRVKTRSTRQ
jgi:hypothetical protein